MRGWGCLFCLSNPRKNSLPALRITLCARICLPSLQTRVTSQKSESSNKHLIVSAEKVLKSALLRANLMSSMLLAYETNTDSLQKSSFLWELENPPFSPLTFTFWKGLTNKVRVCINNQFAGCKNDKLVMNTEHSSNVTVLFWTIALFALSSRPRFGKYFSLTHSLSLSHFPFPSVTSRPPEKAQLLSFIFNTEKG